MKRDVSTLKKHIEESPKLRALKEKRQRLRRRLIVLLAILFCTCLGGAIYMIHLPRFELSTIVVSGNEVIDTEAIRAIAEKSLEGNYGYSIPRRSAFFYPKQKIQTSISAAFPRIASVDVYRQTFSSLEVDVSERRGTALWCGQVSVGGEADFSAPCYFTDETAKIISPAPNYSGNVYPRFFGGSIPSGNDPVGSAFLDEKQFQNLLAFRDRISALGFAVRAIVLGSNGEDALLIDIGGEKTAPIRFMDTANYGTLADDLSAALSKDALAQALAKDKGNLAYFDLRFESKVYYKFTDGQ